MNEITNGPITRGAHHIGLTVPNLDTTRKFFVNILSYKQVGEIPDYPAVFLTDGSTMLTLWQAIDPVNAVPFDRKNNIGLHHLALTVKNHGTLDHLYTLLQHTENVNIEFKPEPLDDGPAKHMMCIIPGGIRVEFIAPTR